MTVDVPKHKVVELENDCTVVEKFCRQLLDQTRKCGFGEDDLFGIHLALEEAATNAVKHGNADDPARKVSFEYLITPTIFDITIADQGSGFKPDKVPDPRQGENIYKMGGRGLLLMKTYMDIVEYNERGNKVHMAKSKTTAPKPEK